MKVKASILQSGSSAADIILEMPPDSSLRDLLLKLSGQHNEAVATFFSTSGEMVGSYLILLNGRSINTAEFSEKKLKEGDEVVLMPVTAGGTHIQ